MLKTDHYKITEIRIDDRLHDYFWEILGTSNFNGQLFLSKLFDSTQGLLVIICLPILHC